MRARPARKPFKSCARRRAVAAVELAVVLPLLVLFLLGAWEVGRLVEVQQLLTNACREGGRQCSTGVKTVAQVKQDVVNYLQRNGISKVAVGDVTVQNISKPAQPDPTIADQLEQFRVSVSIPFDSVRWILLNQVTNAKTLNATVDWYCMRDIPVTVDSAIPLK